MRDKGRWRLPRLGEIAALSPLWRAGLCAVVVLVLLLSLMGTTTIASANQTSIRGESARLGTMTSCAPDALAPTVASYSPPISKSQASNNANHSSQYSSAVASLGSGYTFTFVDAGFKASASTATCSISGQTYQVAYSILNITTNVTGQLSIFVDPNTGTVTGSSISWPVMSNPHAFSGQWTGYTTSSSGRYTAITTWGKWAGFGASGNGGNCGATVVYPGLCKISFWTGLTHTGGGRGNDGGSSGAGAGVAQSGFDSAVLCVWSWWGWTYVCAAVYTGWCEFYPANPVYCSLGIGAADTLMSYVTYVGTQYWAIMWDISNGNMCWGYTGAGSMGAPVYGQFQSESDLNPIGGLLQIPNFNFWYNPTVAGGYPSDLRTWVLPSTSVAGVGLGPMTYNSAACAGSSLSCFQVT